MKESLCNIVKWVKQGIEFQYWDMAACAIRR